MNYLQTALEYHAAGLHVIPVDEDKRPRKLNPNDPNDQRRIAWMKYQERQARQDVERLFKQDCWGIAILTGVNGLEVIDVDQKYDPTNTLIGRYGKYNDLNSGNACPITDLVIEYTKGGGYHLVYYCGQIEGNKKLARRPALPGEDGERVLIETRGKGGYIVAAPSPGYVVENGEMTNIPRITPQQRQYLFQAARHFDEMPKQPQQREDDQPRDISSPGADVTPWDDFNAKHNPVDLLLGYGWTYVSEDSDRVYLKRPGDTDAATSGNYHKTKGLFVCHSTSTVFETEKGYSAYAIYTQVEHGGDFSASAKELRRLGYGTLRPKREKNQRTTDFLVVIDV